MPVELRGHCKSGKTGISSFFFELHRLWLGGCPLREKRWRESLRQRIQVSWSCGHTLTSVMKSECDWCDMTCSRCQRLAGITWDDFQMSRGFAVILETLWMTRGSFVMRGWALELWTFREGLPKLHFFFFFSWIRSLFQEMCSRNDCYTNKRQRKRCGEEQRAFFLPLFIWFCHDGRGSPSMMSCLFGIRIPLFMLSWENADKLETHSS